MATNAIPRCPHCNAHGIKHLANHVVGAYMVVFCSKCGAIFGVIPVPQPKKQATAAPQKTEPETEPNCYTTMAAAFVAEIGHTDLSQKTPYSPHTIAARLKAAQYGRGTLYRQIAVDDGPPRCLIHHLDMVKIKIPPQYPNGGRLVWVCREPGCKEWELAE